MLPWRRHQVDVALAPLLEAYLERHRKADTARIEAAYDVALEAHAEQVRRSGEPYISHPLGVARILADLGLDDVTIAAALLHDAVEDTALTQERLEELFGAEVAAIVDGVTKLDRMEFESRLAQQAATMRKMLVAMANDIRVLLIKLADRLHNMRTIASLPEAKQVPASRARPSTSTPRSRTGSGSARSSGSSRTSRSRCCIRSATRRSSSSSPPAHPSATRTSMRCSARSASGSPSCTSTPRSTGRPKHYWSIYEKMVVRDKDFDEIIDLLGVRVVVDSVKDCYAALGSIHAWWRPVQGRFKDYIAQPKFNLYQSLHTTVVGPGGRPVEVQIRTEDMNRRAEFGVAAHWGYKESESAKSATDSAWLQRLVEWQHETEDPEQFMKILKGDLEADEVFVFTPKGKVVILPTGATPVDFAYAIHTEVGHRCIGARANGRLVPLDALLTTGDTVEIVTSRQEGAGPTEDWLEFAQTPRARAKIRQRFSKERREDAIDAGRDDLVIALRGRRTCRCRSLMGSELLAEVAEEMHYADLDSFYAAIGDQHVAPRMVAQRVRQRLGGGPDRLPVTARKPSRAERAPAVRRGARRGARRHVRAALEVLHAGARRRDHRVHDPRSGRVGAPHRLPERGGLREPARPRRRGGVGQRRVGCVRRGGRGGGARPVPSAARRRAHARRAPREHPLVQQPDVGRPRGPVPVRVRARRPRSPRFARGRARSASTPCTTPPGSCPVTARPVS